MKLENERRAPIYAYKCLGAFANIINAIKVIKCYKYHEYLT